MMGRFHGSSLLMRQAPPASKYDPIGRFGSSFSRMWGHERGLPMLPTESTQPDSSLPAMHSNSAGAKRPVSGSCLTHPFIFPNLLNLFGSLPFTLKRFGSS